MSLTREQILQGKRQTIKIDVPDLGEVLIRKLSVGMLGRFLELKEGMEGMSSMLFLAVASICDEDGVLLFTEDDLESLKSLSIDSVKAIGDEVMKLNGMGPGQDEEAVKNS